MNENSEDINKKEDVINKNEGKVDFNQEIKKWLDIITTIQDKKEIITNTNEVKDNMYKLIETFDNLVRDQNNQSKFADEENIYVSRKIISTTLQSLNNMSERLIESTNDCYSKEFLDKLENILCCFNEAIKNTANSNLYLVYTRKVFNTMKNIMEHKKKLLLTAIENLSSNQQ